MWHGRKSGPTFLSAERNPAPSIHVLAAVDRQRRAGEEARILVDQESDSACDLFRPTESANRNARDDLGEHLFGDGGDHVRVDITGSDSVHGYARARAFLRQRLRESVYARFGSGVIHLSVLPGLAVDRADVDDAPVAAAADALEDGLGHVEAAAEIGVDDGLALR